MCLYIYICIHAHRCNIFSRTVDNHAAAYLLRDTEVLEVKWEWLPGKASPEVSFTELSAGCPIKGLALSYWKKIS